MIQKFFESQGQKIKSVKLLFRASQNNFTVANFHNTCNGQGQTITICENTYGKIIGGYTPLAWNSNGAYQVDGTMKSFTFSLTNNHKFVVQGNANHVYGNSSYGPTFSNHHDFYIADNCNQNFNSHANVNYMYKNTNYTAGNVNSYAMFTGGQQNHNFKVKQYEVWKVEFAT